MKKKETGVKITCQLAIYSRAVRCLILSVDVSHLRFYHASYLFTSQLYIVLSNNPTLHLQPMSSRWVCGIFWFRHSGGSKSRQIEKSVTDPVSVSTFGTLLKPLEYQSYHNARRTLCQ